MLKRGPKTATIFIVLFLLYGIGISNLFANSSPMINFGHIDYTQGLSHNHIISFAEDNNGFIWIGTRSGLNRYDGIDFKIFKHSQNDSTSLPDNVTGAIEKDQLGRFWMNFPNQICLFNPDKEEFIREWSLNCEGSTYQIFNFNIVEPFGDSLIFFHIPSVGLIGHNIITNISWRIKIDSLDKDALYSDNISDMKAGKEKLFLVHNNGIIEIVNPASRKVEERLKILAGLFQNSVLNYVLFIDNNENIWIFSTDEALGLVKIDKHRKVTKYNTKTIPALNSELITDLVQDANNNLWIGTDHGGINILNQTTNTIQYVVHEPANENSISQNVITRLYRSNDSVIWIGTFKQGINFYHKNLFRYFHYTTRPYDKSSLPYNDVNCFVEDDKGNLWIGTNGKGLIYFDRKNNTFNSFKAGPDTQSLNSDVIVSLYIDSRGKLWIATYHGGLSYFDGTRFYNYMHDPEDPNSIKDNRVWDIFEDSHGNLWIGMLSGGLDLFNRKKDEFIHYSGAGLNSLNAYFVMDMEEDNLGNVWFATDQGVFQLDYATSRFIRYSNQSNNKRSLSNNFIYNVFKDSQGNMWIGTRDGLNLFNPESNNFIRFNTENGLSDNSIMSILESDLGDIWLGTSNGLTKLVVNFTESGKYKSHYTISFNESDGLQGKEFNEGSSLKTRNGELIFGGSNGFNLFIPENEQKSKQLLKTHIVGLEIFGNEVDLHSGDKNKYLLKSSVLNKETIKLPYDDNMFSLKFVCINYLQARKINYRYKLEGFNDHWIYTDWQERKATYTNLNPGKYTFRVQAADYTNQWDESEASLRIVILPPWYLTWIAYVVYGLIVLALVIALRWFLLQRERNRFMKEQAIKESERQHELNLLKTRFFTNVSHEFRTPLTLIITPLESLLKKDIDSSVKKHLELMYQNARRLLNLVNQLLDFRKAEASKLKLNLVYGNIIGLLEQTIFSFTDLRESKSIQLDFLPEESSLYMQFDKDKIEKIILNLLSNAFKFTPENGIIQVSTQTIAFEGNEILKIAVKDNGIGISEEQQQKIFERFYQSDLPSQFITRGSGVGLSLTKDFVELHEGKIYVKSEIGKGSVFIVEIPVNRQQIQSETNESIETGDIVTTEKDEEGGLQRRKKSHTILLVEDNADFRFYLRDNLQNRFNIVEAENGKLAVQQINIKQPDLIVSDIMMPEMDGLQLCNYIKTNPDFSHIPVILLTAKSTQQDKIEGLKQGADEYLTKPFSFEILESRIQYLINVREKFIKNYQQNFTIESDTETITPLDEKLLDKTLKLIQENISNTEFSVEKLSKELGMSRVNLYKKISSLTGKTPIELIRLVRLKRAADLLIKSQLTISQITYEVGFSDPRYFSKQFKTEFNVLPSKYRENQGLNF